MVAVVYLGVVACMVAISQLITIDEPPRTRGMAAFVAGLVAGLLCSIFVTPYA